MYRPVHAAFGICFAVAISLSFPSSILAGTFHFGQASLKGLQGVHVGVEALTKQSRNFGLTKKMILEDVELQLGKAKVTTVSAEESLFSIPGAPSLNVAVNVFKITATQGTPEYYAYSIDLRLLQEVILGRDEKIALHADTWRVNDFGQVTNLESLRTKIKEKADEFASSYKAANSGDGVFLPMKKPIESDFTPRNMPPLESEEQLE